MNRSDLQRLCRLRVQEARYLLSGGHYAGAYYLAGYAVEAALKACIAKQVRRHDFPSKTLAGDSYTHDLNKLVTTAGLAQDRGQLAKQNPMFDLLWTVAKDWDVESRYEHAVTRKKAEELLHAVTARKNEVLSWLTKQW